MRSWRKRVYFKLKGSRVLMKEIINFIEANVDGKTLFTNELVYKLENGALQGVFVSFRLREKMWRQRLS